MPVLHQEIATGVKSRLEYDDRIEAADINVLADNEGTVTLTGMVPSFDQKLLAEQEAARVRAVRKVINELMINPDEINDEDIKVRASKRLTAYKDIDEERIEVSSENGRIRITGTVDAYHKKKKVTELMSSLPHVGDIVNDLAVTPNKNIADEAIAEQIMDSLRLSPEVNPEFVVVEVNNGDVVLSGIVDEFYQKESVENTAAHTSGVRSVENKIRIE